MSNAPRKVSLRFFREGPTHNHLLSPLTPYLATVGRNDSVTVRMPYEHRRLLRDLATLRYGAGAQRGPDPSRITGAERRLIADDVSAIFEEIPGLNAEIGTAQVCHPGLVHLELVFSAAELSMLPFELATAPRGFPGEGLPLSVQVSTPIAMTRTVPSAPGRDCNWNVKPRILFAWASPPGLPEVPHQAHLAALIKSLTPWTGPLHEMEGLPEARAAALAKYLVVLPSATLRQLADHCRAQSFTHVHLLAHGTVAGDDIEPQYALALQTEDGGGAEPVNAERLQAALRLPLARMEGERSLSHPLLVSLATCDSSNQSQVVTPGMSLAHALHAAGVPLVVGSLFPITFGGSVAMTESLYEGLLSGKDPRWVLYETRHRLFRRDERTHDWAGMVAYASFAENIAEQFTDVRYLATCASIDAHIDFARRLVDRLAGWNDEPTGTGPLLDRLDALDRAIVTAEGSMPDDQAYLLEGHGMRASAEKKRSRLLFDAAQAMPVVGIAEGDQTGKTQVAAPKAIADALEMRRRQLRVRSVDALRNAQRIYRRSAQIPPWAVQRPVVGPAILPTLHWVLTQALSLDFVLRRVVDVTDWHAAVSNAQMLLSSSDLPGSAVGSGDAGDPIWAHGSLMELHLLSHGMGWPNDGEARARRHLNDFLEAASRSPVAFFKSSTVAQLERYAQWWFDPSFVKACGLKAKDEMSQRVVELARDLIKELNA